VAVLVGVGVRVWVGVDLAVGGTGVGVGVLDGSAVFVLGGLVAVARVGVIVGASVAVLAHVSAAKTVKCVVAPVTVPAATSTVEGSGCHVAVVPSKKNTPAGCIPLKTSVTWTGVENAVTGPLRSVAVKSTALLTSCWSFASDGAVVRAMRIVVSPASAPAGKDTVALPSGSPREPPPEPMTPCTTSGFGEDGELACEGADVGTGDSGPPCTTVGVRPTGATEGVGVIWTAATSGCGATTRPSRPLLAVALRTTTPPSKPLWLDGPPLDPLGPPCGTITLANSSAT